MMTAPTMDKESEAAVTPSNELNHNYQKASFNFQVLPKGVDTPPSAPSCRHNPEVTSVYH